MEEDAIKKKPALTKKTPRSTVRSLAAVYLYFVSALTIIAVTLAFFKTFTVYNIVTPQKTVPANWQTFNQKLLGMSFLVPKNAKTDVFTDGDPKSTTIRVTIPLAQLASGQEGNKSLTLYVTPRADVTKEKVMNTAQNTLNSNKERCPSTGQITPLSTMPVGMYNATGFNINNCNGNYAEYFLTDGKTVFELSLFSEKPLDESGKAIRQRILSSFTFSK